MKIRIKKKSSFVAACAWGALAFWLWLGAPTIGKVVGALWFAASFASPAAFYYSLIPALALFGNNPGGPHHLYLIELAVMGLVMRHSLRRSQRLVKARHTKLDPWVSAFVFWSWLCLIPQLRFYWVELCFLKGGFIFAIFSHYANAPTYGLECALKLSLAAGMYAHLRDVQWGRTQIMRWFHCSLGVLTVTAVLGLGNYFGIIPLAWWRGENVDILRFNFPRLQSLYWHSGWYAQYVEALAPMAMAIGWLTTSAGKRRWAWAATALFALVTFLTMQRAGWLGLAAGFAVVAAGATWMRDRESAAFRIAWRTAAVVGVLVVMALATAALSHNFRQRAQELVAYQHRTTIWQGAIGMIQRLPVAGVGFGNYHHMLEIIYNPPSPVAALDYSFKGTAHNVYLHIGAERGLVGLALFAMILFVAAKLLRERMGALRRIEKASGRDCMIVLGLAGGLTALAVDGLFQYTFYVRTIELLFWLLLGLTASLKKRQALPVPAWRRQMLAVVGLLIAVYFQRSYLQPWTTWVKDQEFYIGGQNVSLELPPDASRIELKLASIDPDAQTSPVKFKVRVADRVVAEETFTTPSLQTVRLDVKGVQGPIVIEAERDWSPFAYGNRDIPVRRVGVLYQPPVKLNDQEALSK